MSKEFKEELRKRDIREYYVLKAMADLDLDCPYLVRHECGLGFCSIYAKRPKICKAYPPDPQSRMEGCGYYFE